MFIVIVKHQRWNCASTGPFTQNERKSFCRPATACIHLWRLSRGPQSAQEVLKATLGMQHHPFVPIAPSCSLTFIASPDTTPATPSSQFHAPYTATTCILSQWGCHQPYSCTSATANVMHDMSHHLIIVNTAVNAHLPANLFQTSGNSFAGSIHPASTLGDSQEVLNPFWRFWKAVPGVQHHPFVPMAPNVPSPSSHLQTQPWQPLASHSVHPALLLPTFSPSGAAPGLLCAPVPPNVIHHRIHALDLLDIVYLTISRYICTAYISLFYIKYNNYIFILFYWMTNYVQFCVVIVTRMRVTIV